jgi:predicted HTH domain antitoxin
MNDARSNTDEATIKAAVALMRTGAATIAEVAELAGRSRQIVAHWARRAGIDATAARAARLQRLWRARVAT